jgi:hypothetical protein
MPKDHFACFQIQTCVFSSPDSEDSFIPYNIVDYSIETHSFRVIMTDQRDEQQISEPIVLTTSPLLMADFLLNRERVSNG